MGEGGGCNVWNEKIVEESRYWSESIHVDKCNGVIFYELSFVLFPVLFIQHVKDAKVPNHKTKILLLFMKL